MQNCNCSNKCRGSLWKTYMHRLNGGRRFLENRTSLSPSIQAQMSSGDLAHTSLCLESRTTYQWAKQINKAFIRQGITRTLILYKYSSFCLTTPFLFCHCWSLPPSGRGTPPTPPHSEKKNDTKLLNPQLLFHHLSFVCFPANADNIQGEKMSNYASSPTMLFSFTLFGFFDWIAQGNDLYTLHSSTFQLCHATNVNQHSVLKQHSKATLSDAEKKCITHTHACMHACTHIRVHAHTHTHTHTHSSIHFEEK